ncbi:cell division protein SepF [Oribacterium sp. NK2B42]|uniref:cell division protein SepF n=1 Tax=Oribacterium sp. NK2B42 TaxID=689781 RepID=UPI000404E58B|nr:cell division protein SepF [Oribacterium sp. NK2B42]MBO5597489.1 cell division protein SepF [Oribacterium sp.]MBO6307486.1 cell division protein SepF [Oribacterium sp.]MBP3806675.1 cell division protein SepF [Oribacterium sp.]MBR1857550.1 cell division protein SepF [Oribacterium sp.]MCR5007355.1 cell division protein SepF [Oribacterium sp.]
MSFIGNIMKNMRVNQDDEYDLQDDYDFEDGYDDEPQRNGLFSRRSQDEDDDVEDERPARPTLFMKKPAQPQTHRSMEVTMIKPTSMDDSRDICDYLLDGKAVVLNMEGLHMEIAQRIIDFTSGAAYSMNGNLQKISNYIFIATPQSVELSGDFQNILAGTSDAGFNGLNLRV